MSKNLWMFLISLLEITQTDAGKCLKIHKKDCKRCDKQTATTSKEMQNVWEE
jgi:RES domain-containing protein